VLDLQHPLHERLEPLLLRVDHDFHCLYDLDLGKVVTLTLPIQQRLVL